MHVPDVRLKEFAVDSGIVSAKDLEAAEAEAAKKKTDLGSVLVNKGTVSEDDLRSMQAYILGIPFVDLKNQRIDFGVLSQIPEPIARNHNIIAYKKEGETLEVAMLDTDDLAAISFIKKKTGFKILPRLTDN